jgi:tetratricopeptide (TPR) repeat protein
MARKKRSQRRQGKGGFHPPGYMLWIVVGVVVVGLIVFLSQLLSRAAPSEPLIPVLATANPDLTTMTRMLGDIERDSTAVQEMPEEATEGFRVVDSLIGERNFPDAIERLLKLRKTVPEDKVAVIHDYLGFCYARSASPDRALREFRDAMDEADPEAATEHYRAAFCAGYLFQSRGFADSARAFYDHARHHAVPDTADRLYPALLNNLALSLEAAGDTAAALAGYEEAALYVDTAADERRARVLRDNLRRLARPAPEAEPD